MMNIFQMSFYGGILILVIAALRPIALNRLPKKTFLALWIIAFLRLLILNLNKNQTNPPTGASLLCVSPT